MTVLGIGAVVAITLALAGVIDPFNTTLDTSRAEALAGARQRLTVDLTTPQPANSSALRAISTSPVIGNEQLSLRLPTTLSARGRRLDAFLEFVARDAAPLWHPTLSPGRLPDQRPGLVIAARAAQDLHVRIGDWLTVRYPVPNRSAELPAGVGNAPDHGNPHQPAALRGLRKPARGDEPGPGRPREPDLGRSRPAPSPERDEPQASRIVRRGRSHGERMRWESRSCGRSRPAVGGS